MPNRALWVVFDQGGTKSSIFPDEPFSKKEVSWARGSVRQSGGLLIRTSRVQIPSGPPPIALKQTEQTDNFNSSLFFSILQP